MVPLGSTATRPAGKVMKPPCSAGTGLSGSTVTTGSRQEKSTPVTGRSPGSVGLETGDQVTWAVAEAVGCGGLTAAVGWDWLQPTSKIPTRQSTRALMSRSQAPTGFITVRLDISFNKGSRPCDTSVEGL